MLALVACAPAQRADVTKASALDATQVAALPTMKSFATQAPTPSSRSNAEIAADFMDLEFNLESGRALPVLTRFEGPVTVALRGDVPPSATADLGLLLARLRDEAGIDIASTPNPDASITIDFQPRQQMQALVPTAACFVAPRVAGWAEYRRARHSDILNWATLTRRDRLSIFVPSESSSQEVRDCLHEELAQALGPLNDLYRLSDSVFNDDNFQAVLTGFDMLILRLHYSRDLQNGMTPHEVAEKLPTLLARLNPHGEFAGHALTDASARPWIDQIETALGPNGTDRARIAAADQALAIAQAAGWADNRLAFSYFAVARLNMRRDVPRALASFAKASRLYSLQPYGPLHVAHVDLQMAAFALSAGEPGAVITLTDAAIPIAKAAQNAGLLASLMLLKAQALDRVGRAEEAQALRLDSLGWARYGFGSESVVRARMADIAALSPIEIGG